MNHPVTGSVFVRVGDLSLLSQAYGALQASLDLRQRCVSDAGMQRLRQLLSEVEDLSDRHSPGDLWAQVTAVCF